MIKAAACAVIALLIGVGTALAQDEAPRSLAFTVTSDEIRLTREGTTQPIRLRRDAVAVVGEGDTLTTDRFGRVMVAIDTATLLVMPGSAVTFQRIADDNGITVVTVGVTGHAVYSGESPRARVIFDLAAFDLTAEGAAAVWPDFEGGDLATVASGSVTYQLQTTGGTAVLQPGHGLFAPSGEPRIEPLNGQVPFLHAAQMIGLLYGCPSTVIRTGGESLNLRVGPSLESTVIGFTDAGDDAIVMGRTEGGNWRRVQRFSGFGWMSVAYLEDDCESLTVYPNTTVERNLELVVVQPRELAILSPFFGTPESNPWVYRSFRASPYEDDNSG